MNRELPEADQSEKEAYLSGLRVIFVIEGNSMLPVLKPGDRVFINPESEPEIGDIVLFRHPFIQNLKVVKRLAEITSDGRFYMLGDNPPESTDSRSFGAILKKDIVGVAVCRLKSTE